MAKGRIAWEEYTFRLTKEVRETLRKWKQSDPHSFRSVSMALNSFQWAMADGSDVITMFSGEPRIDGEEGWTFVAAYKYRFSALIDHKNKVVTVNRVGKRENYYRRS